MDRRQFIKISALTGGSATLASCGNPEYHLIRFIPEDRIVAGIAAFRPSICPLCPAACGLTVRVMQGDIEVMRNGQSGVTKAALAKKLEGNPAHPVNQGKLCTRGQAAAEITYHPDRVGHPLKRSGARGDGQFQEISWDDALNELVSKLDELQGANDSKSLGFLTSPRPGLRNQLIAQFANRFGAGAPVTFEFFGNDVLRRANALSFGRPQLPTFDLGESRYVISFGADFLGTWNSPVAQNVAYGKMRQGRPGIRGKFVQVESRMSLTGANADEWVPTRPGTEGVLALGLAHAIMKAGVQKSSEAGRAGAAIEGWANGLGDYTPQEVEKRTGVAAAKIERLAKEIAEQRPAVAVIGGTPLAYTNGLFNALAVNALNALLGSVESPGGVFFTPAPSSEAAAAPISTPINKVADAGFKVLFLDGVNPVFATPDAWKVRESLSRIPYIVSFGNFIDETSVLSDLILPDHSFLESWVEGMAESGSKSAVLGVAPPVMAPLHETRSTPDLLLDISRRLKKPLNLPWQNFEGMLKAEVEKLPKADWAAVQRQGGWWEDRPNEGGRSQTAATAGKAVTFAEPQFDGDPAQYPFHFLPYASQMFLDGSLAHLPLMQELPDPLSSAVWSSWVEINEQTAEKMGIHQGDLVEIASQHGTLQVPAFPSPGIAPDVIAMPVGQGHETYTRYASGRGQNPIRILAPVVEQETGALAWAATRVKITRVANADGRLVLFAGSLRDYPPERHHR
jgi:anaerobic selenocysteine-containing dehydrogenase